MNTGDIFVSSSHGNDGNPGTKDLPVQSLKKALSIGSKGRTIHLADGQYDTPRGESWPEEVQYEVDIEGDTANGVVLSGALNRSGLVLRGGGRIKNLSFLNFERALEVSAGSVEIGQTKVSGGGGFDFSNVHASLTEVDMQGLTATGVVVEGGAHVDFDKGSLLGNPAGAVNLDQLHGVSISSNGSASISNVLFDKLGSSAIYVRDSAALTLTKGVLGTGGTNAVLQSQILLEGNAAAHVEDTTIRQNGGTAVMARHPTTSLTLVRATIDGATIGVYAYGYVDIDGGAIQTHSEPAYHGSFLDDVGVILDGDIGRRIVNTSITADGYGIFHADKGLLVLRGDTIHATLRAIAGDGPTDPGPQSAPGFSSLDGG